MLAHFSHHLLTALPVPLLPFIRDEFALDYTRSGFVISAFALTSGLSQLPGGWLADRIGRRLLITIGISGVGLAGLLVGLSQTYIMLLIFLVLMGMAGGGYHPASPPLLSASVEPKNRGQALGFHLVGGGASHFSAPLIAAAIAAWWGWRGPFVALAVPIMLFGVVFYMLLGRLTGVVAGEPRKSTAGAGAPRAPGSLRPLAAFVFLSTFTAAVLHSLASLMPLFMVDNFGVSREVAAIFMSAIYLGFVVGPLGGYISDRLGRVPVILAVCFMAGPVVYLLNVVPYGPYGLSIGAVLFCIGVIQYVRMPVSESYIVSKVSERHRSTVLGIYYFGAIEGSGVLTPVIGYLFDRFGFATAFNVTALVLVAVTVACAVLLWDDRDWRARE